MQAIQRSRLRKLTLTASLAAVYTIFRAIPISRLIGISGSITAAGMVAPVIGILLEPSYGIVAVFTGTMIASLLPWNPLIFGGLDFLPGAVNVALVSLVVRGRRTEATLMFLMGIGLFILNPYTTLFVGRALLSPPIPYLWMHLAALMVLVSPLSKNLGTRLSLSRPEPKVTSATATWKNIRAWPKLLHAAVLLNKSLGGAIAILAFTGTMIEHLAGGILYASIFGSRFPILWSVIFLAYPVERTVIVVGAILICTPLLRRLSESVIGRSFEVRTKPVTSTSVDAMESGKS